jgi:hypothetical protein
LAAEPHLQTAIKDEEPIMRHLPVIREPQPRTKPTGRLVNAEGTHWAKIVAADPDLVPIVAFCTIGLLMALNMMLWFPNIGAVIAQSNLF